MAQVTEFVPTTSGPRLNFHLPDLNRCSPSCHRHLGFVVCPCPRHSSSSSLAGCSGPPAWESPSLGSHLPAHVHYDMLTLDWNRCTFLHDSEPAPRSVWSYGMQGGGLLMEGYLLGAMVSRLHLCPPGPLQGTSTHGISRRFVESRIRR